jgi:threonyl-tRNA synthetase
VEKGDNGEVAARAVKEAAEFAKRVKRKNLVIYPFAHLSNNLEDGEKAKQVLHHMLEEAKSHGLQIFYAPFGWNKRLNLEIKGYPLAEQSRSYSADRMEKGEAQPKRAEKVQRGIESMSEEELLARISKSDFTGLPETDHRIIGEKLDLFSFQEPSPGMVYWHKNGLVLFEELKNFIRSELEKKNYIEISTPALANTVLWKVSGHSDHYKDDMFLTKLGEEEFGLKPMNCPATFLVYKSRKWSYRDLPVKYSTFDPLYRNELSGVASGLFRVKELTQDDAHIITPEDRAVDAVKEILELMERVYSVFGLTYRMKLSTKPDEHMGTDKEWEYATNILIKTLKDEKLKYEIKDKEGNFYAPKIDVDIKDSMGREWQCGTVQMDLQMPKRFRLAYTGEDGKEYTPAVVHRTLCGSLERFIGILIEHYQGNFPTWLAPIQVRVISISEQANSYAEKVHQELKGSGIRAGLDVSDKTLEYKIREAQLMKIPYMLVVGKKEMENNSIAVRNRSGKQRFDIKLGEFVKDLKEEISKKSAKPMF